MGVSRGWARGRQGMRRGCAWRDAGRGWAWEARGRSEMCAGMQRGWERDVNGDVSGNAAGM